MRLLDRYIARHVLGAILAMLLIVVGLDLIFTLVDELDSLKGGYGFTEMLYYLALTTPRRIYEFIPLSALVGCLIGLGALASSSELTVSRAAGVSTGRIVVAVFKPIAMLVVIALLLGEFVVPKTEQEAQSYRSLAQSGGQALRSEHGVWNREGNEYAHINAVRPDGTVFGVTRYRFDENGALASASFARSGTYQEGYWQLKDVRETRIFATRTEIENYPELRWDSGLTPTLLSVVVVEPVDLSISGLWSYSQYLAEQGVSAVPYQLAFWSKLLQPLAIMVLVLIAVSFIFGPLRSVTVGQRIIVGIMVGVLFKFAQDLLGPAATVYGMTPLLAVALPILLCALAGGLLLRRAA